MFSVIIPVYNTEQYLRDCLDSVVNQTVPFAKIIIVNDGSTDGSLAICEEYQKHHSNIQIITQKNQGQGVARNQGITMVESEYLMFLDSDDFLEKNTLEVLYQTLKEESLDVLYFDANIINELDDSEMKNHYDRTASVKSEVLSGMEYFQKHYPKDFTVSPCMVCFRRSFIKDKEITFPAIKAHEDELFSLKALLEAEKVKYLQERLYVRRYRPGSTMTSAKAEKRWHAYVECCKLRWKYLEVKAQSYSLGETVKIYQCIWDDYFIAQRKAEEIGKNPLVCKALETLQQSFFVHSDSILRRYKLLLKKVLCSLPFGEESRCIGIYGTGYHTEQLLEWYCQLCGEIKCNLYFLDTYKETVSAEYMGCTIVNITDAKQYVDYIIISSSKYEKEMCEKVTQLFGDSIPIKRFYETEQTELFINYKKIVIAMKHK